MIGNVLTLGPPFPVKGGGGDGQVCNSTFMHAYGVICEVNLFHVEQTNYVVFLVASFNNHA